METVQTGSLSTVSSGQLKRVVTACETWDRRRYDSQQLKGLARQDLERMALSVWIPSIPPILKWSLPQAVAAIVAHQTANSVRLAWPALPPEVRRLVFQQFVLDYVDAVEAPASAARDKARKEILRLAFLDKAWLELTIGFLSKQIDIKWPRGAQQRRMVESLWSARSSGQPLGNVTCLQMDTSSLDQLASIMAVLPSMKLLTIDLRDRKLWPDAVFGCLGGIGLTIWLLIGPFEGADVVIADTLLRMGTSQSCPRYFMLGEYLHWAAPKPYAPATLLDCLSTLSFCESIVLDAVNAPIQFAQVDVHGAALSSSLRKLVAQNLLPSRGLAAAIIARLPSSLHELTLGFYEDDGGADDHFADSDAEITYYRVLASTERGSALQRLTHLELQQPAPWHTWPIINLFAQSSVEHIAVRWQFCHLDDEGPLRSLLASGMDLEAFPKLTTLTLPAHLLTVSVSELFPAYMDDRWEEEPYSHHRDEVDNFYQRETIKEFEELQADHADSRDELQRQWLERKMDSIRSDYEDAIEFREQWQTEMLWRRDEHNRELGFLERILGARGVTVHRYDNRGPIKWAARWDD